MLNLDLIDHDADLWGSVWTDEPEPRELVRVAEVVKQLVSPRMPIRLAVASVIKRLEEATISSWFRLVAGDAPSTDVEHLVFAPPGTKRRFDDDWMTVLRTDTLTEAWEWCPVDEASRTFELDELAVRRLQGQRGLLSYLRGAWTGDSMRSVKQLDDDVLANRIAIPRADAVAAFGTVEAPSKQVDYTRLKALRTGGGAWSDEALGELAAVHAALVASGHKTTSADVKIGEVLSLSESAVKQQRLKTTKAQPRSKRKAA